MINLNKLYWFFSFIIFVIIGVLLDLNISSLNLQKFYENENIENEIGEINFTIFFNKKLGILNDEELIKNIIDQYLIDTYLKKPAYYVKTKSQIEISSVKLDDLTVFENLKLNNLSNFVNKMKVKLKIYSTIKDYDVSIKKLDNLYLFLKNEVDEHFDNDFMEFIDFNFSNKYNLQLNRIYDAALSSKANSELINIDIDNIFMYEAFDRFVQALSNEERDFFLLKIKLNTYLSFDKDESNVYLYSQLVDNNEKIALTYFDDLNLKSSPKNNIVNTFPIITLAFIFLFLLFFLSIRVFNYK